MPARKPIATTPGRWRSRLLATIGMAVVPAVALAAQSNEISTSGGDTSNSQMTAVPDAAKVTVTDDMMKGADQNGKDWLLHGRTWSNQRYSPLDQINADNVSSLQPVALVQTAMPASFETTPIVVDGVMYATTPMVDGKMKIMAFDAATGKRYWETTYDVGTNKTCCGPVNRGVAVGYGKVYVVTLDAKLLALDAKTGKKEWEVKLANPQAGYSETMAPQIYDGR